MSIKRRVSLSQYKACLGRDVNVGKYYLRSLIGDQQIYPFFAQAKLADKVFVIGNLIVNANFTDSNIINSLCSKSGDLILCSAHARMRKINVSDNEQRVTELHMNQVVSVVSVCMFIFENSWSYFDEKFCAWVLLKSVDQFWRLLE